MARAVSTQEQKVIDLMARGFDVKSHRQDLEYPGFYSL